MTQKKNSKVKKIVGLCLDRRFTFQDMNPGLVGKLADAVRGADQVRINCYSTPLKGFDEPGFINFNLVNALQKHAGLNEDKIIRVPAPLTEEGKIDVTGMIRATNEGTTEAFIASKRGSLSAAAMFAGINEFTELEK